jgi:hypothetical protein
MVWTGKENLAPTGILSPDRPARSESLYRLSYPGPIAGSTNTFLSSPEHPDIPWNSHNLIFEEKLVLLLRAQSSSPLIVIECHS